MGAKCPKGKSQKNSPGEKPENCQNRRKRFSSAHCAARHARPHARTFASPRTDDRRTNDATCGPQAWLNGSLHYGGIRSARSPLRRPPLLTTPIATPLQCGRPKRSDLLVSYTTRPAGARWRKGGGGKEEEPRPRDRRRHSRYEWLSAVTRCRNSTVLSLSLALRRARR